MKKENIHNITSSGFKTPDNYFESLDAQILERISEKEMISGSKTTGFTVPKDYFNSVESMVFEKLAVKPEQPVITLKPRRTFYYVAGIAASLVLLVSLVFNNTNESLNINTIDTASIENYLYQEDYSNDDLANLFKTDNMSETDFIDIIISDDYIDQYIDNIDTEDLNLD
ncbi:hypothetical protein [Winogradskyella ludwigii]|jgi:hypothetical protein|uniref:hypothetical protein n=1 Tax=Winogradskyella ludwigii TaxID=2686076 RepID=UPI0015C8487E|nr:hypothetical protein [Winogradskyella ludwigii]